MKIPESVIHIGKPLAKYKYLLLVVAAGLIILLWPKGADPPPAPFADTDAPFDLHEMERRLAQTLSAIDGVGQAEVMLTLKTDMEVVVVQDINTRSHREVTDGKPHVTDDEKQTKTVLTGSAGGPIITKRIYPQYQGALIVCGGAKDAQVQMAVLEAVTALTGLRSDAVTIAGASPSIR